MDLLLNRKPVSRRAGNVKYAWECSCIRILEKTDYSRTSFSLESILILCIISATFVWLRLFHQSWNPSVFARVDYSENPRFRIVSIHLELFCCGLLAHVLSHQRYVETTLYTMHCSRLVVGHSHLYSIHWGAGLLEPRLQNPKEHTFGISVQTCSNRVTENAFRKGGNVCETHRVVPGELLLTPIGEIH